MAVQRILVEKKDEFAVEAKGILSDIKTSLRIEGLKRVRVLNCYDVEGITSKVFESAKDTIFSEPQVDLTYSQIPNLEIDERIFISEYLPGQFDQRADSAAVCISVMTKLDRPIVRSSRAFILKGDITDENFNKIKSYIINPVESREASLIAPNTLKSNYEIPTTVETLVGFINLKTKELEKFVNDYSLAMDIDDILFCQEYFKNTEKRDPTITEIRMIDTYWSDHCRHTTFLTNIDNVDIKTDYIKETYDAYLDIRKELYVNKNKPITLMDLAIIGAKKLKKDGFLNDLDESEEINACSVKIKAKIDGVDQDWLLMFKNETHNHPTEIEPFGGAATCLGGAIRDPLSGRSYVYQAMRVTGAADPLNPVENTIHGKLPQKKIVTTAANGYSSYGNQIGLSTGHVTEIYHPGYVAKRMEIGAVIGAAPIENVVREVPSPDDIVILLGGRTGRDGCGGATGSSKSHTLESLESCGAEVQKGNPPEERKIQRLFRKPEVTKMIKRCNDFGAGGISVAIGELSDGLIINLDCVPKKYDGLDGTELAISESQERMAVVVSPRDAQRFLEEATKENLEATIVAKITEEPRLVMSWNDKIIVNLSREFLNSNGAVKHTDILIESPNFNKDNTVVGKNNKDKWFNIMTDLNVVSQKGLVERFDSTIGAGTVLMPFGGKYQLTPTQAMAAKISCETGDSSTCSIMGWGYNPYLAVKSPYHSAMCAVIESVAKVIAVGGNREKCWLTFQEYFERTKNLPNRWGKPLSALLGALKAQLELKIGAIGGKDSMSGTFENIDVPPTLVSFAVSVCEAENIISPEFKKSGSKVVLITPDYDENKLPVFESVRAVFDNIEKLIKEKKVISAWSLGFGGVSEAVTKMSLGNKIGFEFISNLTDDILYAPVYGGFVLEIAGNAQIDGLIIGKTIEEYKIKINNEIIEIDEIQKLWEERLESVFPCNIRTSDEKPEVVSYMTKSPTIAKATFAKPRVLIPVFYGTNCEYDSAKAFEAAGATADIFVVRNLTAHAIEESIIEMKEKIANSQIIMLPGGFSGGDEPEGSAKLITAFFRNEWIKEGVNNLLKNRDGLMLGICNGFQALIKLGLVPYGEIRDMDETCPTLTFNTIGRHQSMLVRTRVASNLSPWLKKVSVGDVHTVAISHGEGRFVAPHELVKELIKNGQIATQYVDLNGKPSMDIHFNPNTSMLAIEGITSPDGRIFGKMAHSERKGLNLYKNVDGEKDQSIFESGVEYFK